MAKECSISVKRMKMEKTKEVVSIFERAVKADENCVMAFYNLKNALHDENCLGEAIEQFKTATKLDPSNTNAHFI